MTVVRRGACPSLSAPMQTGDGLLVRLSLPERSASPLQLRRIAEAAARHGNGILEITRRGGLQVRGLSHNSAILFAAAVRELGLPSVSSIPIDIGPLAGLDPGETVDPRSLAETMRREIAESGVAARLGPKVSVVIDGGGRLHLGEVSADVRLVALPSASGPTWELAIAGTARYAERLGQVAGEEAAECVSLILAMLAEKGPQARARDIDPSEFRRRLGQRLAALGTDAEPVRDVQPIGFHDLVDHGSALGLGLPFGQIRAEQIIELEGFVTDFRFGPGHTLLAIFMPSAGTEDSSRPGLSRASTPLPAPHAKTAVDGRDEPGHDAGGSLEYARYVQTEAGRIGFIIDPRDPRRAIAACPGAPACASGHMTARNIAEAIAADAADILDGSFTLHVSGCAKGCAHPGGAALTLVGDSAGCGLVVAGDAREVPQARVGGDHAVAGFARLATLVRSERLALEDTAACLDRLGERRLAAAFGAR